MSIRKLLVATLLAVPMAAQAEFSYNYLEGYYTRTDISNFGDEDDGFDGDVTGATVRGSLGLGRNLHLSGEWTGREIDAGPFDVDIDTFAFGGGVQFQVNETIDLVGDVQYYNTDIDDITDEDGWRADIGLRGQASPNFEIDGGFRFVDIGDDDSSIEDDGSVYIRGIYSLTESFGLSGEFEFGDDFNSIHLGGRLNF